MTPQRSSTAGASPCWIGRRTGNVAETCRSFGISRTRYYEWKSRADRYGLEALMPKERRAPQMPEATPTHVVERLLTLAVSSRRSAVANTPIGSAIRAFRSPSRRCKSTWSTTAWPRQSAWPGRPPSPRRRRDSSPRRPGRTGPSGSAWPRGGPGELVCLDSFYIGKFKGVGKVYQLSAIDVFTRWAVVVLVVGPPDVTHSMRFVDQVLRHYRRHGVRVRAVL